MSYIWYQASTGFTDNWCIPAEKRTGTVTFRAFPNGHVVSDTSSARSIACEASNYFCAFGAYRSGVLSSKNDEVQHLKNLRIKMMNFTGFYILLDVQHVW
jgi:hypothetical protein